MAESTTFRIIFSLPVLGLSSFILSRYGFARGGIGLNNSAIRPLIMAGFFFAARALSEPPMAISSVVKSVPNGKDGK